MNALETRMATKAGYWARPAIPMLPVVVSDQQNF